MVALAKEKTEAQGLSDRIRFETGNIQEINLKKRFDAVICMFAVLSYQTTNEHVFSALRSARMHLKPNGLFICDFWYGPAVLCDKPSERIKITHHKRKKIIRVAKPSLNIEENVVTVSYHVFQIEGNKFINEVREDHRMRYFFRPEMDFFLSQSGLKGLHFCAFLQFDAPLNEKTWNVSLVARAI